MHIDSKLTNFFYQNIAPPPAIQPTTAQLVVGLITPLSTLLIIILLSSNVPFYDQWRFVPLLDQFYANNISLETLWAQHNEHRIVFPRLLMLVLASISEWDIRVEIGAIWIMAVLIFLVLCRATNHQFDTLDGTDRIHHPYKLYIAFSILIFSMVQVENWLWGWQITMFMSVLSTIVGYYALVFKPFKQIGSLLFAILCGIIATLSFANGLLYWPIGLIIIVLDGQKKRFSITKLLLWVVVATAMYICYFTNYQGVSHHPSFIYGLQHPIRLVCYYIFFIGSPICQAWRLIAVNFIVGVFGLFTLVYLINFFWKQKRFFQGSFLFWHSLLLYVLFTAAITALGRSGFGLEQALSSRYVTISNLFWVWLIVVGYALPVHERNRFSRITPFLFLMATSLIVLSGIRNVKVGKFDQKKLVLHEKQLRSGKLDLATLTIIYKEAPMLVLKDNKILKRHKLSFYAH